jgi:chromate transporter
MREFIRRPARDTILLPAASGGAGEVWRVFARLGLTSFGGPIAHLGYLRRELVLRRGWGAEETFADLVALCQFLPGPASSQLGIAFGLLRAGPWGALAAWAGFTLPSAVAMLGFAAALRHGGIAPDAAWLHGLRVAAVAIVVSTVWGMAASHCRNLPRQLIALAATVLVVTWAAIAAPVMAILLAALIGWRAFSSATQFPNAGQPVSFPLSRRASLVCLTLFAGMLVGLPVLERALPGRATAVASGFFWAGTFVFDGGPGAVPLFYEAVVTPGWVSDTQFLTGFAAAEAMPGPLLTFGDFLGMAVTGTWLGGVAALLLTFLPSSLVVLGALPFWGRLHAWRGAPGALQGINAAVVGILLAALYDPIWRTAILSPRDAALALGALRLLETRHWPPVAIVILTAGAAAVMP